MERRMYWHDKILVTYTSPNRHSCWVYQENHHITSDRFSCYIVGFGVKLGNGLCLLLHRLWHSLDSECKDLQQMQFCKFLVIDPERMKCKSVLDESWLNAEYSIRSFNDTFISPPYFIPNSIFFSFWQFPCSLRIIPQ